MSDPNKWYNRQNGNSRTVKITFFCTGLIKKIFTIENDGKVKNRQT